MGPKRKARKNRPSKKTAKAVPTPRKTADPPAQPTGQGNTATPLPAHPFLNLSAAARRDLDVVNYGFKHTKFSAVIPVLRLPRPRLPDNPSLVEPLMQLMQNKLFFLREYFLPEVTALIWRGVDRGPRSSVEVAMLAEAANAQGAVGVSYRAQDCLRLLLCYAALFEMEDKRGVAGGDEGWKKAEREINLANRESIWEKLKGEIAEQLPGDKQLREERAEVVLQKVLRLEGEARGRDETEVGNDVVEEGSGDVGDSLIGGTVVEVMDR